ncbi:acetyl-CoA carboxylase biotin carboxyl carrier protein [Peribacillus frigoritolerans]|uniref:acetyl-CoA carboxylase biotin carboxyl carrier protein n=1 Tax=Peribacillus frigoritolerans TaxID=450367 RepID=UPI0020798CE8|nr:acetyl-CoA carboxylase biotin carboxyl carrier protein [Peribacillus frigoritolerans]USK76878.1 acetyl-CoA carboxylase biotin carboxyl carrier protein [Peribacillus frigoritolerans]
MFKVNDIKELIRAVDRSSIGELTIKGENEQQISISKQMNVGQVALIEETQVPATIPVAPVKVEAAPIQKQEGIQTPSTMTEDKLVHKITSPMVGTFYASPSPDSDAYVRVGDRIKEDTVLCIVEAMKLMNELEAEVSGEIVEIFVENGQVVEYGQPLFLVKTA